MSRYAILSDSLGGTTRIAPGAPPVQQNILELIDDLSPISHWRLNEASGSTFADRLVTSNMISSGTRQNLTKTIISNDISSACLALDGSTTFLEAANPVAKPYDVTAGAMGIFIQPDTSLPTKQQVMNRAGAIAGAMAIEYLSGGQVRGWRYDGTGTLREIVSSIGVAPAGDACLLLLTWGPAGLQLYRNETPIATVAITDWAVNASLNASVAIGIWPLTDVDPLDAVVAHAFFLGAQPTGLEIEDLATAVSISWAQDIDAGAVNVLETEVISLKTSGAHFKAPIVPTIILQGELGAASVNGEAIDYEAAGVAGFDDEVVYSFTSANGSESQQRSIIIDVEAVVEFPLTLPGAVGWMSTTHWPGVDPANLDPVENILNVGDGSTLFTQATAGLRGFWDTSSTPPVIRANDDYYTRATALASPALVIIGCIIDSDATGNDALAGAASTQTPGGDANEDAWHIRKTTTNTMRGLVAASGGIAFTDVAQVLNEKLLIVMRISGDQLTIWQNGFQSVTQTISGTRIASNGAQALFARYYNNAIDAGTLKGGIAEFIQYSDAQSLAVERQLIEYFQDIMWPAVTPPPTADLDAGNIAQGATLDFDVIAGLAAEGITTTGMTLVSIHEQSGAAGVTVSVVGGLARITVAAGATLGLTSFVYCVQRATA